MADLSIERCREMRSRGQVVEEVCTGSVNRRNLARVEGCTTYIKKDITTNCMRNAYNLEYLNPFK